MKEDKHSTMWRVLSLVCLGLWVCPVTAPAFTSCSNEIGFFTPACITGHWQITIAGAAGLGFSWPALTRVADANVGVDTKEISLVQSFSSPFFKGFFLWEPEPVFYDPTHHFDHYPGVPHPTGVSEDQQAFVNARNYVLQQMAIVTANLGGGKCDQVGTALDALGRALHAIQDVYAHSNYVDLGYEPAKEGLDAQAQSTVDAAVSDASRQPPASLRLTLYGFPDSAGNPENPTFTTNDCFPTDSTVYCHQFWAKDNPDKNPISGSLSKNYSVYIAASMAAQAATARFITKVISSVGNSTWNNAVGNYGTSNGFCQKLQPPCSQMYAACNPTPVNGEVITSGDPNDKAGSLGVGIQQYIAGATPLRYAIQFGNELTATAPARKVVITDQLNTTNEDLSTFALGPLTVPNQIVVPPLGPGDFSRTLDLRPVNNLLLAINTHLNVSTGLLTWTFQSVDPTTNKPPADPTVGFLPPGGNGSVFFTVNPKQGLPTNTQIQNQATIVFDANMPISTPTWLNTLDNTPPTSHVTALPATETTTSFTVKWSGSDVGSGIATFTVYVSDNGGPFTAFQTNTAAISAAFSGQAGHTYGFFSIATDAVGNVEPAKTVTEATTTLASAVVLSAAQISTTASGLAYSRVSKTFNGTVTITNISASALNGPFQIVLTSLTSGVMLANATGTFNGSPFITVPSVTSLTPGQAATVNVQFTDASNVKINFTPVVYSGSF